MEKTMDEIVKLWNSFAKMKVNGAELVAADMALSYLRDCGVTDEIVIAGIKNYKEALELRGSMANHHPIGMFLKKYLRESYMPGMYDPKRYQANGYKKKRAEVKPYKLPEVKNVATLEERKAMRQRLMGEVKAIGVPVKNVVVSETKTDLPIKESQDFEKKKVDNLRKLGYYKDNGKE